MPEADAMNAVTDYDVAWDEVYGNMQDVGPVHRHMRRMLEELLAPIEYRSVIEIGCGAGHNLPLLTEGRDLELVTGFDVSERALARAGESFPGASFVKGDIQESSVEGEWDLVFCSLVLEHLPADEAALAHMREICTGKLVLTTIAGDFERYRAWDEQMGHVRNYGVGELEGKLERAGFHVDKAIYWGWPFYTPIARTLQNGMTSEASYSRSTKLLSQVLYGLYFLNSRQKGDLLIISCDV